MNVIVIALAGISSRFNENKADKILKGIYYIGDPRKTILYSILKKCNGCKRVILVGGYEYESLEKYIYTYQQEFSFVIELVYNPFYDCYGSGYSLWKGLQRCLISEKKVKIIFVEGDLYFDEKSFERIKRSELNCITYNREPIYSNKAVVAYINGQNQIKYIFNTKHGLLQIEEPFCMLMNSGQIWKFVDSDRVEELMYELKEEEWKGTNLIFIERYFRTISSQDREIIALEEWENCNTRDDYLLNMRKL